MVQGHSLSFIQPVSKFDRFIQIMRVTFGLFTQVGDSWPHGPFGLIMGEMHALSMESFYSSILPLRMD